MYMENIYRFFKRNSWQFPAAIVVLITPFMIIGTFTKNENLEILAKIFWLLILFLFIGYSLLMRALRKKFDD